LPNIRSLSKLRSLLPYAAKLLPVLTGVVVGETAIQPRPDLSALNRHFGEMQNESRGLRSRMEGQGEQLERMRLQIAQVATDLENSRREQQELASAFRSLAGLLKGLLFAMLLLLVAAVVLGALILFRMSHP
jgi:hypothetical protein